MNRYTFNELQVGMAESFSVTITEEMLLSFQNMTGDINPLHSSTDFAAKNGYCGRVVYGMLTASFLSTLAGVYLPGENSLIHSVETSFTKPVYIGDILKIEGRITEKSDTVVNRIILKVSITNQNNEKVLRGKMTIGVSK